jgi:recombinational DNA repair protein (RecF pathway)
MAPAAAHAESFDGFAHQLGMLEAVPGEVVASYALRAIWTQVAVLGFAPAVDACAMDGRAVTGDTVPFSIADGGILCSRCAVGRSPIALPRSARDELAAFLDASLDVPILDARHAAAHRRLVGRWIRFHAGESPELSALAFWEEVSSRPAAVPHA